MAKTEGWALLPTHSYLRFTTMSKLSTPLQLANGAPVPKATGEETPEDAKLRWIQYWSKQTEQAALFRGDQMLVFARGNGMMTMGSILVGCNGTSETFTALVKQVYNDNPRAVEVMLKMGLHHYTQWYEKYFNW